MLAPTWDDPIPPPASLGQKPHPQDDPSTSDDIEKNQHLDRFPTPDQFDALCGVDPALTPIIHLDTEVTENVHFLGDTKGEPVTLRLSDALVKMIDRMIAQKSTGHRTRSEFLRDAAFYLTRAYLQLHNISDARLRSYMLSADISAKLDFAARLTEQITKAEHDLTDYLIAVLERGALLEAVRAIDHYENDARAIPIDWWRDQWLKVLQTNPLVAQVRAIHQKYVAQQQTSGQQAVS